MLCPHFSKVKFQKIKQISNQEMYFQQQNEQSLSNSKKSNSDNASDDSYSIAQQSIDSINNNKYKISTQKYRFTPIIKQDSIKQSQRIKLPKQMNIKKVMMSMSDYDFQTHQPILSTILQSSIIQQNFQEIESEQTEIPSQNLYFGNIKNPHVLVSKSSMMANNITPIYNGFVFLQQNSQQPFSCELKQFVIKISQQHKIKYFIQLLKVKVNLISTHKKIQKMIQLHLTCKNKNGIIKIYFMNPLQKQIFIEVYYANIKKIKQNRSLKRYCQQNKQNLRAYDQQQSQILDQLNDLQQNQYKDIQQNSQISSLSLSSYEGDSLVFQTQRFLFNQVRQKGNTFDILLFKNKSLMSKFQRIFTNSDYDHTAMLLRTASNQLLMLQATSNAGVAIYTFNSLMRIDRNKYFQRIGLRRYTGQKNLSKIQRLQNFIRKTVGKKYKFDPMYLLKSQANKDKQTFFCSQLVAQALQDVGIISNQIPSFKYLPKHFAQQSLNNQIIDGRFSDTIILQ